jgi:hypothetical protein
VIHKTFGLIEGDWLKIGKGLLIAVVGAAVAHLTEVVVPGLISANPILGPYIGAAAAVGLNFVRKWVATLG